ncbi:MAG: hypothetical protein WCC90_23475 [Methylocella sp.]
MQDDLSSAEARVAARDALARRAFCYALLAVATGCLAGWLWSIAEIYRRFF